MGASASVGLVVTWRRFGIDAPGWLIAHGMSLVALGAGWMMTPGSGGWWALTVWVPLVLLPTLAHRLMARNAGAGRRDAGRMWARVAAALHPLDGWESLPLHLEATQRLHAGDREGARVLMAQIGRTGRGPAAREATLQVLRLDDRWAEICETVQALGPRGLRDPNVAALHSRALGELGEVREMLRVHMEHVERHAAGASGRWVGHVRIVTAALAGQPELVGRLLGVMPLGLASSSQAYWVGTALQASGRYQDAAVMFEGLAESHDALSRDPALRRLREPLAEVGAQDVPDADARRMAAWAESSEEVAQYGSLASLPAGPPARATRAIVLILVAVFGVELATGAAGDAGRLFAMGALAAPAEFLDGQWWRVFTGAFLHFNEMHVLMNAVALWYFGRYLERVLGAKRLLVLYGLLAPASMAVIVLVATLRQTPPHVVVGASGAVMALLGVTIALLWQRWRRRKASVARHDLGMLIAMLAFQTAFDISTPEISFVGHAAGVVLGFFAGLVAARGVT